MPIFNSPGADPTDYPNYIITDGTPATGVSQDSGGTGAVGWFSSIVKNLRLLVTSLAQFEFDGSGNLKITGGSGGGSGTVSVSNFPGTQAISASALPLPAGAAQDSTVAGITTAIGTAGSSAPTLPGSSTGVIGFLRLIYNVLTGTLTVNGSGVTQPVSNSALSFMTFDGSNNLKVNIAAGSGGGGGGIGTTGTPNVSQIVDGTTTTQKASVSAGGALKVDNSGVTQPVSASSLPLPAGAALDTSVQAVNTTLGTAGTSPPTLPGSSTGLIGFLRYIASLLAAFSTAGTSSSNVITVQGAAGAVAQPVSLAALPALTAGSALIGAVNLDVGGTAISSSNPVPVLQAPAGLGVDTAISSIGTITTTGTSLGSLPTNGRGVIVHLPPGASISFYVAASQAANAGAALAVAQTYSNSSSATTNFNVPVNLSGSNQVWVTNSTSSSGSTYVSGAPVFRFV